ncbi:VOC family protein [Streptomyces varsoviensis]|uniref:VOC family protein n=1 Tax=Streptomyces varsoviensis TaxID=67373 RepID=UPI0033F70E10
MEFTQIRLLVTDFGAVYRFYRDVLGLQPQFEAEGGPYAKFTAGPGQAGIALQDRAQMAGVLERLGAEPEGYRAVVVLRVDDLNTAHTELASRGAEFLQGPAPMGERILAAHLADPEGNVIELQEWLALRDQPDSASATASASASSSAPE